MQCKESLAQGEYNNWHFGINTALKFTDTGVIPIYDSKVRNVEGAASISDSAGNLLFYAGMQVYDRSNNIMKGDTQTVFNFDAQQGFLIIPKPESPGIYYYLRNFMDRSVGQKGRIYVNVVDMNKNGGLGEITAKFDTLVFNTTEQLTATRHRNGTDLWVVTHDYASNKFLSFLVTKNGINRTAVVSAVGHNVNSVVFAHTGTIKISQNGCWLAATIRERPAILQLLHFDNSTGKVSGNARKSVYAPYGIEFSPNSRYLYLGSNGTSPIIQYDLASGSDSFILANGKYCSDTFFALFDFQLAPDNKIWILGVDKNYPTMRSTTDPFIHYMGQINFPNKAGLDCHAKIDSTLWLTNLKSGLPNNINLNSKNYLTCTFCDQPKDTLIQGKICKNDTFKFSDSTYTRAGKYKMIRQTADGCDSIVTLQLNTSSPPPLPELKDTSICEGNAFVMDLNHSYSKIYVNGQTENSPLKFSKVNDYVIKVMDSSDCELSDTFSLKLIKCDSTELKIPNVFTPGKDGFNDGFDIMIVGEKTYQLSIYDRWGVLVFEQNEDSEPGQTDNWNGQLFNNGPECADGNYYYLFKYSFGDGKMNNIGGCIQLIR
ncbi:MAG TPA: gliding motility-associated C-terminal domain-containing protein [Bacteroidia bacterium]